MKNIIQLHDKDELLIQASDWVARLNSDDFSEKDEELLHAWLERSDSHAKALLKISDSWDDLSELSQLALLFPLESKQPDQSSKKSCSNLWFFNKPKLIGTTFLTILLVGLGFILTNTSIQNTTKYPTIATTEIGQRKTISLSDGSVVTLNTDSLIDIRFNADTSNREIILKKGEAHFNVASDPNRPFIVIAGNKKVTAIGTAFNMQLQSNTLEVVVTEGIVEVSIEPSILQHNILDNKSSSFKISAGNIAIVEDSIKAVDLIDTNSIEKKLFWKQGKLYFEGESLKQVIAEVGRYTTTYDFIFLDDKVSNISIGGYFSTNNIEELLNALEKGFNVNVRKKHNVRSNNKKLVYLSSKKG